MNKQLLSFRLIIIIYFVMHANEQRYLPIGRGSLGAHQTYIIGLGAGIIFRIIKLTSWGTIGGIDVIFALNYEHIPHTGNGISLSKWITYTWVMKKWNGIIKQWQINRIIGCRYVKKSLEIVLIIYTYKLWPTNKVNLFLKKVHFYPFVIFLCRVKTVAFQFRK